MSALTDFFERLRAIVFRSRDERELREELDFHVEMETRERRRTGLDESEARRQSLVALGGIERTREDARDARGTRLLHDALADAAYAARTLARRPGFSIVAVLTLAIGIGGTTAVFSAVDAVLLQPLPYAESGSLVRLYQGYGREIAPHGFVTPVHFAEFRNAVSSFESFAAIYTYSELGADIGSGEAVRRIRILPVSAGYFEVLRTQPSPGSAFTRADEVERVRSRTTSTAVRR